MHTVLQQGAIYYAAVAVMQATCAACEGSRPHVAIAHPGAVFLRQFHSYVQCGVCPAGQGWAAAGALVTLEEILALDCSDSPLSVTRNVLASCFFPSRSVYPAITY